MKSINDTFYEVSHRNPLLLVSETHLIHDLRLSNDYVRPGADDGVDEPGLLPVSRIVIPEPDAKASQGRGHLPKRFVLSSSENFYDGHAVEFSSKWSALDLCPLLIRHSDFLVGLAMVLKHLGQWISSSKDWKIDNGDFADDNT